MAKSIIVCIDGTWNTPQQAVFQAGPATNVRKLYEALPGDRSTVQKRRAEFFQQITQFEHGGTLRQVGIYLEGVGTQLFAKIGGGAFGFGIFEQIKDGYEELVRFYEPGDQIFLFGFSRGAFAARSLSGMLNACGILQRPRYEQEAKSKRRGLIDALFDHYKGKATPESRILAGQFAHFGLVHFLGVWDTVGALGLPVDVLSGAAGRVLGWIDTLTDPVQRALNGHVFGFLNTKLAANVTYAYHALGLDEQRTAFRPTLWEGPVPPQVQDMQQVWFPGVHSNVGGGYAEAGLSNGALDWMVGKLLRPAHLIVLDAASMQQHVADASDKLHDSAKDMFKVKAKDFSEARIVPADSKLHDSVRRRQAAAKTKGYVPAAKFMGDVQYVT